MTLATYLAGPGVVLAGIIAVLAAGMALALVFAKLASLARPVAEALFDDPAADAEIDAASAAEVRGLIQRLPRPARHMLMLSYADGLTVDEIAGVLDMSRHRVDAQIEAAKGVIAEALERRDVR